MFHRILKTKSYFYVNTTCHGYSVVFCEGGIVYIIYITLMLLGFIWVDFCLLMHHP